jgi:hypothetical protein
MRSQLYRWLVITGLAGATLLAVPTVASAQPDVRDHRHDRDDRPREAPPPLREERVAPRPGFVWLNGRWDWRHGKWEWMAGRYEKEHPGKHWRDARWEMRDGGYVLVDGDWIDAGIRPTVAPPPLREERFDPRPGFIYAKGRWDWRNGNWEWLPGHWERERAGKHWREARWEMRDGGYVLVDGDWEEAAMYPTAAPPPLREEKWERRAGFVWVRGRWDWRNGNWDWVNGHWERERARQMWIDGNWQPRDGRYVWVDGHWGAPGEVASPPVVADRGQPHMYATLKSLENASTALQAASPNKGGHRDRAMQMVQQATAEVRDGIAWADAHPEDVGAPLPPSRQEPVPTEVRGAEKQQNMATALVALREARKQLMDAEGDKGGHREKALEIIEQAMRQIHEGIEYANHL